MSTASCRTIVLEEYTEVDKALIGFPNDWNRLLKVKSTNIICSVLFLRRHLAVTYVTVNHTIMKII